MKRSEVLLGTSYMLSLGGRRGAVRVTVEYLAYAAGEPGGDAKQDLWAVCDSNGRWHYVTPRRLQPMPVALPHIVTVSL